VKPNNWSKADLARLQPEVGDFKLDKLTSAPYIPPNPEPKERLKQYNSSPTTDLSTTVRPAATKYRKSGPDSRRTKLSGTRFYNAHLDHKEKEAEELDDLLAKYHLY